MSDHVMTERSTGFWVTAFVTTVLALAAAVVVGFGVSMALGPEDTEPLESPLALVVTHQLVHGPWELYGPFGGQNPWVIIHAPLYYRLAAVAAWPFVRGGVDPVTASLAAGRALSLLGLAWSTAAAYRIARIDGAPVWAGIWAALLIAASLVSGAMPYAVRPDMLGVALHTTGVLLVLSVLDGRKPGRATLPAAYAAFALAACTKQHFIVGPLVSTFLLLAACARGRLSFRVVFPGLLTGLGVLLLVYGAEELASSGLMSLSVFQAAASTSSVHPVGWMRASIVFFGIMGKSGGLIAVLLAAALADLCVQPGIAARALVVLGTGFLIAFAARTILAAIPIDLTGYDLPITLCALTLCVFLLVPACRLLAPQVRSWTRLDRLVALYLLGEFVLVLILSRSSAGAWINYGIQAIVFAAVLVARALARTCAAPHFTMGQALVALAVVDLLVGVCSGSWVTANVRYSDRRATAIIIEQHKRPASEFYFVGQPGVNRQHGLLALAYDDWLYPVFEAIRLAQPRSIWLSEILTSGKIQFIVNRSPEPRIAGLVQALPDLGYMPGQRLGTSFYVWERKKFESPRRP